MTYSEEIDNTIVGKKMGNITAQQFYIIILCPGLNLLEIFHPVSSVHLTFS